MNFIPAERTYGLEVRGEGVVKHPILGFAGLSGNMAHAIFAANVTVRAVLFPCGTVSDKILRTSFPCEETWRLAIQEETEDNIL